MTDIDDCDIDGSYRRTIQQLKDELTSLRAELEEAKKGKDEEMNALVNRFLRWPLPLDVQADPCATEYGATDRCGTNLLNAPQAKAMLRYVLRGAATRYAFTKFGMDQWKERAERLEAELKQMTSDRDAKSKRMWEIGKECDRLEAENVKLKADAEARRQLNEIVDYVMGYFPLGYCYSHPLQAVSAVITDLSQRIKLTEADSARLDWCDQHSKDMGSYIELRVGDGVVTNIRARIDAAREVKP